MNEIVQTSFKHPSLVNRSKPGGYFFQGPKCHCPTGFELSPTLKDCFIPEAFLLISFAKAGGIQKIPLDTAHSNTRIPPDIQVEASFLDFSVEDDQIYWTNAKEMVRSSFYESLLLCREKLAITVRFAITSCLINSKSFITCLDFLRIIQ